MEKHGYPPVQTPFRERQPTYHMFTRSRVRYLCLFAGSFMLLFWHLTTVSQHTLIPLAGQSESFDTDVVGKLSTKEWEKSTELDDGKWKVPLEAHIMSKCPDALGCLQNLLLPALSQSNTLSKVNFTLSYIGTPQSDGDIACMHGPTECLGNIIELCAAHSYPDPKIYLGFTFCLSKRYSEIPARELVEECALESGIDFARLNDCASREDGAFGMGLLRQSVERSKEVGAGISCTVRLDEEVRCVRDGGEWKDCPRGSAPGDLVRDIEKLYAKRNNVGKV
ncbi:hypothetical protein EG327_008634 [Venturia inaequalis]|uniref:Gamma interferon inducible lysosomal thiol reductase n=1 Tax=Venturia inaequalis TaxID=5025 RepID=A0A8H3UPW5_VENIN|nr:hypothetical protein EG327_008634 [Venturia inaequalis]